MEPMYTCECADGRTLTGTAQWTPGALKRMSPLQLAEVLSQAKDFASFYASHYYYPLQTLSTERGTILRRYSRAKNTALVFGILAGFSTISWVVLAILPPLRFSGITLILAFLTFFSLLLLIPLLYRLISAQQIIPNACPDPAKQSVSFRAEKRFTETIPACSSALSISRVQSV